MKLHRVDEIEGLGAALEPLIAGREQGLVFTALAGPGEGWPEVEGELLQAFTLTQEAFAAAAPIVYLVRQPDLLGQEGSPGAMLAGALLSGARALAMEDRDSTTTINVLAHDDGAGPAAIARWIATLLDAPGISGEVVRLGRGHLGKVQA